jgi:hypothetical protein
LWIFLLFISLRVIPVPHSPGFVAALQQKSCGENKIRAFFVTYIDPFVANVLDLI